MTFEVSAEKLVRDAAQFGWELRALEAQGRLKILSTTRRVFQSEVGFDVHFVKPVSEQLLRDALGAHHTAHR